MAALCVRPTDCLAGRAFFGAHRGVRATAAPRPASRRPMKQDSQNPATAAPPVPGKLRPARGRPNGRQRGRRSSPPAGSPPHKRVMENVVILKRGEKIPPEVTAPLSVAPPGAGQSDAQAEKAEPVAAAEPPAQAEFLAESVAAADKCNTQAEKAATVVAVEHRGAQTEEDEPVADAHQGGAQTEEDEPVAAAGQGGAPGEKTEPVAAPDQRGPGTQAKNADAAEHRSTDATTKAEPVAAFVHQSVPEGKEEDKPVPVAAEQSSAQAKKAESTPPAEYSGTSFVVAPEPRELPIPVFLLKPRSAASRLRARGDCALPTAAAASVRPEHVER